MSLFKHFLNCLAAYVIMALILTLVSPLLFGGPPNYLNLALISLVIFLSLPLSMRLARRRAQTKEKKASDTSLKPHKLK